VERAQHRKCRQGCGDRSAAAPQLVAYGAESAAGRRESREHAPTLGRTGVLPLGLSTGGQSEDEDDDDVEAGVLVELPEEESLEPEVDDVVDAGVVDDVLERLSVR
jgi:hypothetical protein